MFNKAKKRLLEFIQFQADLRIGITEKGVWQFDLSISNDLITDKDLTNNKDDNEPLRVVGFHLEEYKSNETEVMPSNDFIKGVDPTTITKTAEVVNGTRNGS